MSIERHFNKNRINIHGLSLEEKAVARQFDINKLYPAGFWPDVEKEITSLKSNSSVAPIWTNEYLDALSMLKIIKPNYQIPQIKEEDLRKGWEVLSDIDIQTGYIMNLKVVFPEKTYNFISAEWFTWARARLLKLNSEITDDYGTIDESIEDKVTELLLIAACLKINQPESDISISDEVWEKIKKGQLEMREQQDFSNDWIGSSALMRIAKPETDFSVAEKDWNAAAKVLSYEDYDEKRTSMFSYYLKTGAFLKIISARKIIVDENGLYLYMDKEAEEETEKTMPVRRKF